jgi:hypothetical protein
MSERRWTGLVLATSALATTVVTLLAVAGCSQSASTGQPTAGHPSTGQPSATVTAGMAAAAGPGAYTASQLKSALLTRIGGARPAAAAEAGDYGTLPDVQTSRQTMKGVRIIPARCAAATAEGFGSASFSQAPAALVTFRVGRDGVSEVLISATSQLAATALSARLPAGCAHYQAEVDGKTFRYSVREAALGGLADRARALSVKAAGYSEVDVWSVIYQGRGFVGVVTMVGSDASEQGARQLASAAYARAGQALS